jgi:hypothetical protein
MRTKLLLSAAVLGVAGMIAASAQVYSVNVVGYVNLDLTAGFNLVANPLNNTTGNDLNTIMPLGDAAIGTTVFRYVGGVFEESTYLGSAAGWLPNVSLAPGEGVFVNIAQPATVTFVGEVLQGADSNMEVGAGLTLLGSKVPQAASLESTGFPAEVGDTVFFFRADAPGAAKSYKDSTFVGTFIPEAVPAVGEGFWVSKANAGSWTRNFQVSQ